MYISRTKCKWNNKKIIERKQSRFSIMLYDSKDDKLMIIKPYGLMYLHRCVSKIMSEDWIKFYAKS